MLVLVLPRKLLLLFVEDDMLASVDGAKSSMTNKSKAWDILEQGDEITAKSPKTHSFAMNVGLLSADHITVDKWHIRACLTEAKDGKTETQESCTSVQYRRIESITAKLAKKYKLKGYEFQAIVWLTIKSIWEK